MNIGIRKPNGYHVVIDTDELWRETFAHWDTIVPTDVAVDMANHVVNTLISWTVDNYTGEKIIRA